MFFESLSERLSAMVCGRYHLFICYELSMFSMCLDCRKLSLCLFPRDANESTNGEGVFPVVATETVTVVLEYRARILVLQGHTFACHCKLTVLHFLT